MTLREGDPLPHNGRRPRSGRVSDRFPDPKIITVDHIPTANPPEGFSLLPRPLIAYFLALDSLVQ
jgi:hypothetical protein